MSRITTCTRILEWDAAHRVPGHDGKCRNLHGHRYKAEVTCRGSIASDGMILDFGLIKHLVGGWIDENWDHNTLYHLNDTFMCRLEQENSRSVPLLKRWFGMNNPPTAEHIAGYLFQEANRLLNDVHIVCVRVRVWETPNCYADAM